MQSKLTWERPLSLSPLLSIQNRLKASTLFQRVPLVVLYPRMYPRTLPRMYPRTHTSSGNKRHPSRFRTTHTQMLKNDKTKDNFLSSHTIKRRYTINNDFYRKITAPRFLFTTAELTSFFLQTTRKPLQNAHKAYKIRSHRNRPGTAPYISRTRQTISIFLNATSIAPAISRYLADWTQISARNRLYRRHPSRFRTTHRA